MKIKAYSLVFFTWIFLLVSFNVQASQISTTDAVQQEEVNPYIGIVAADMLIILDESEEVMRKHLVEQSGYEMFGGEPRRRIVEPPIQAESHLYQTLQCADWICGLLGRLSAYELQPENYPDFEPANKYFRERLNRVAVRSSLKRVRR